MVKRALLHSSKSATAFALVSLALTKTLPCTSSCIFRSMDRYESPTPLLLPTPEWALPCLLRGWKLSARD